MSAVIGIALLANATMASGEPDADLRTMGVAPYGTAEHATWERILRHPKGGFKAAQQWQRECNRGNCMQSKDFMAKYKTGELGSCVGGGYNC